MLEAPAMYGPLTENDILRAARSMIRDYGANAAEKAAADALDASARGSTLVAAYWRRIEKAIIELESD